MTNAPFLVPTSTRTLLICWLLFLLSAATAPFIPDRRVRCDIVLLLATVVHGHERPPLPVVAERFGFHHAVVVGLEFDDVLVLGQLALRVEAGGLGMQRQHG